MGKIYYFNGFNQLAAYPDQRILTGDSEHPIIFPSFNIQISLDGRLGYSIEKEDGHSPINLFNDTGTVSQAEIGKMLVHIVRQALGKDSDPKSLIAMNDDLVQRVMMKFR